MKKKSRVKKLAPKRKSRCSCGPTIAKDPLCEEHGNPIEQLLHEQRAEVRAIVQKFRQLTVGQQRNYGSAALYLLTVLERAIQKESAKKKSRRS
jgi:hypothetical protein